jgi:hypothetical protein
VFFEGTVSEVESSHIHPLLNHFLHNSPGTRGWSNSANNLGFMTGQLSGKRHS